MAWFLAAAATAVGCWGLWRAAASVARFRARMRALSKLPHAPTGFLGALDLISDINHLHHLIGKHADDLGGLCYLRVLWTQVRAAPAPAPTPAPAPAYCNVVRAWPGALISSHTVWHLQGDACIAAQVGHL